MNIRTACLAFPLALATTMSAAAVEFELGWELIAGDGMADDAFGSAVLVDGNLAFIGAPKHDISATNAGAVYVVQLSADGTQTEVAKLLASDAGNSDQLGGALALDGETLVVGAAFADGFSRGAAYIFERPPGGWSGTVLESARLVPSDRGSSDRFGIDVAIRGDTVAVGANGDDDTAGQEGAVYVFEKPAGGWTGVIAETAKLIPAPRSGANSGEVGTSVAMGDGIVVSGSRSQTQGDDSRQGRGLVFVEPMDGWSGVLNESAVLLASDRQGGDRLGRSVAVGEGIIAVGATSWDIGTSNTNNGAVYLFEEPPGGWSGDVTETAILISSEPFSNEALGLAVAIDGPFVISGTDYNGTAGDNRESVYVFRRPEAGWSGVITESQRFEDDITGRNDFANHVDVKNGRIVVGAPDDDFLAGNAGRAYVFQQDFMFADGFEAMR